MIDFLILILIVVCFLCLIFAGLSHRARAHKEEEPVGSIFYHIKQCFREDAERKLSWIKNGIRLREAETVDCTSPHQADKNLAYLADSDSSIYKKKINPSFQPSGDFIDEVQFSYPDKNGFGYEIRRVSVQAVNDVYLDGYCHTRSKKRTFALQRIRGTVTSLVTGEVQRVETWADSMRKLPNNGAIFFPTSQSSTGKQKNTTGRRRNREWQTAAYFVGFRDAKRTELETMADAASWQVRSGFSSSLDILVTGSLVGSKQLKDADSMQIEIISESDFRQRMAELGVAP